MPMHIIGAGLGRTGTYSLKLALNRLGLGPCHQMEAVIQDMPTQMPLWSAALTGAADWSAIFDGFSSTVDWPTASFYRELGAAYLTAGYVLTHRGSETWADSFGATIYTAMAQRADFPPPLQPWVAMAHGVIAKAGFPDGLSRDALVDRFIAHNEAVKSAVPASRRLLVWQVEEGWEPLCAFVGKPVPDETFPRSNNREEFWENSIRSIRIGPSGNETEEGNRSSVLYGHKRTFVTKI